MAWIFGIIFGFVSAILLTKILFYSSIGRTIGAIVGIAGFFYCVNHNGDFISISNNYTIDTLPFPLAFAESVIPVFLVVFGVCGFVLAIIQIVYVLSNNSSLGQKKLSNTTRWILTIILVIIAMVCISTVILAPIAYACKEAVKSLWREN